MASHTQNSRYYFHFYSHFRKKPTQTENEPFFRNDRFLLHEYGVTQKKKNTHSVERQRELRYDIYIYEGE